LDVVWARRRVLVPGVSTSGRSNNKLSKGEENVDLGLVDNVAVAQDLKDRVFHSGAASELPVVTIVNSEANLEAAGNSIIGEAVGPSLDSKEVAPVEVLAGSKGRVLDLNFLGSVRALGVGVGHPAEHLLLPSNVCFLVHDMVSLSFKGALGLGGKVVGMVGEGFHSVELSLVEDEGVKVAIFMKVDVGPSLLSFLAVVPGRGAVGLDHLVVLSINLHLGVLDQLGVDLEIELKVLFKGREAHGEGAGEGLVSFCTLHLGLFGFFSKI